ncbi:MAG: hypothetical protein HQK70_09720 [Desulfamplus sp.]|nr:hypothetical protein [Desulfamplus sp.]
MDIGVKFSALTNCKSKNLILFILILIFFSFLTLAIKPDISFFIPEMVGISGFIVILLAILQLSPNYDNLKSYPHTNTIKKEFSAGFILIFAFILRLMFLFQSPTLSDDIYRYCLDGIMIINGHNPYSYKPLQILELIQRPEAINSSIAMNGYYHLFQSVLDLGAIKNIYPEISTLIPLVNHPEFTTIYPPMAQIVFAIGALLGMAGIVIGKTAGIPLNIMFIVVSIKLPLIIMDTLSCLLIILILRKMKLPAYYGIIYAWHPLPILETASSGHIDGAAIFFLLMSIYLAIHCRGDSYRTIKTSWRRGSRNFWNSSIAAQIFAGLFMGFSILTKWLPLIFLPFVLLFMQYRNARLIMGGSCIGAILIFIIPFCPDMINSLVTLNQYLQNWEFSGLFFRLVRDFMQNYSNQSGSIARGIIFMLFTVLYTIVFFRFLKNISLNSDDRGGGLNNILTDALFMIALAWVILTPTLYPWYALYFAALLPFALNSNFNITGITLSWSVMLSYKVLILYKLTGDWVEDTTIAFMIMAAPLTALIAQTYMRVCKSRF